ncbi:hypothetical protein KO495_02025 [Colwellia sp. D2M02]|uniref:hypothetical protein n=1 Tax=Colwellia sp. D2M02 TaxID=2841562 RepID=UPI001C09B1A4|nr:hypothetical protein [Colwellia sp. D2M02]MBU2892099.1 hypothetical protein [Colwellia sp. D2M02]
MKSINNEQDVEVNKKVESKTRDISHLMSKSVFMSYQDVADFIEHSPKVTVIVPAAAQDKAEYGNNVMKSLTGTDCDRDGKMDDNKTCNAVYLKLWLKYGR